MRGPKYEQLQQAIAANELKPSTPATPPHVPVASRNNANIDEIRNSNLSRFSVTQNDVTNSIPIINERLKECVTLNPEERKRKESVVSMQSDKSYNKDSGLSSHVLRKSSNHSVHSEHSFTQDTPLKSDMILNPAHLLNNDRIINDLHSFTLPHERNNKTTTFKNQTTMSLAPIQNMSMSLDRKAKFNDSVLSNDDFVMETPVDDNLNQTNNIDLVLLRNNKQFESELTPVVEEAIKAKWNKIVGNKMKQCSLMY